MAGASKKFKEVYEEINQNTVLNKIRNKKKLLTANENGIRYRVQFLRI